MKDIVKDLLKYAISEFFTPFLVGFGVGVVRFENGICTASGNFDGTCFTRRQCNDVNGTGSTNCASGIGVCCVSKYYRFDELKFIIVLLYIEIQAYFGVTSMKLPFLMFCLFFPLQIW